MLAHRPLRVLAAVAAIATCSSRVSAQRPDGAALVRLLGARAQDVFAPRNAPAMGGLVRLPRGTRAADFGLQDIAPGIARVWGTPAQILSFANAHRDLPVEVSPPLHLLLDTAGRYVAATSANASGHRGKNVLVGIADTGIDLTHADFQDASGGTRVAWLLDLSVPPAGKYPDLERKYGSTNASGAVVAGAVWAKADIDAHLSSGATTDLPKDEVGHGTLVAACAAGDHLSYAGVAPQAGLLIARIVDPAGQSIGNDEMLRGVQFLFDRADAMSLPVAVNLSVGTDFGPHDGTLAWEQTLASHVGAGHPGHALVVAAGNSGSIADPPVHQNVHVSPGATTRVPLLTRDASHSSVAVWVAMHAGADLRVGLDAPYGTWISPVARGDSVGGGAQGFVATAVIDNGSGRADSLVPAQSRGAVVIWTGQWPAGTYYVTLSGSGTADLYVQETGDAAAPGGVSFRDGVREGTITLPATHPGIIAVGCTINKKKWRSVSGYSIVLPVPLLDAAGGEIAAGTRDPIDGEPCWFSSAGPTLTGAPKPDIMAPGAAVIGAMSAQAMGPASIFTNNCPAADPRCQQVDATHAATFGTSFSAPLVAGAAALLFERDPTLTQDEVIAAIQGGSHPLRGPSAYNDQSGPGELDVAGALVAVDRLRDPQLALPQRSESWMTLGADVYLADGSTPLEAIVELRATRSGGVAAPPADGFGDGRLAGYARVAGALFGGVPGAACGAGVWVATVALPAGLGGSSLTVGATFDGTDIVEPKSVPIATDLWNAAYAPRVRGGCAVGRSSGVDVDAMTVVGAIVVGARRLSRRRPRGGQAMSRNAAPMSL